MSEAAYEPEPELPGKPDEPASGGDRTPKPFVPGRLTSARIYDYLLGGKDSLEVDREFADSLLLCAPEIKSLAWFSRSFMLKSVEIAAYAGITQFIELGSGFPCSPNVHEVVQNIEPAARVAYVDYDPVAQLHCEVLLSKPPNITAILGDIRDPDSVIKQLRNDAQIDFNKPVAVLFIGVLHYVMDDENPHAIVAAFRDQMSPGSYLAIAHGSTDSDPELLQILATANGGSAQVEFRSATDIERLFDGLEVLKPGVAQIQKWLRPDLPKTRLVMTGAISRKTGT